MSFKLFLLSLLWFQPHHTEPSRCRFQPLPAPEIFHDFYRCSTVVDWRRYVSSACKSETVGYEVQYINGCSEDNLTTVCEDMEMLSLPNLFPGECFEDNDCYVRVRTRLNEPNPSWSDFSAWTTLSSNFKAMKSE